MACVARVRVIGDQDGNRGGNGAFTVCGHVWSRVSPSVLNYAIIDWTSDVTSATEDMLLRRTILIHQECQQSAVSTARASAEQAETAQRRVQDARNTVVQSRLPAGTRVLLRVMAPAHKLGHRFEGPFFILPDSPSAATNPSANYWLQDAHDHPLLRSFPRDQVFECPQPSVPMSSRQRALYTATDWDTAIQAVSEFQPGPVEQGATVDDPDDRQQLWAVERIMDADEDARRVLVKFVGYDKPEWISEGDFTDSQVLLDLLQQWRRVSQRRPRGRLARDDS